jgi:hypothetical protein
MQQPSEPAEVNLTTLASTYGVLRTTPAYPQVQDAIARIEEAARNRVDYPERERDIVVVRQFAELLRASGAHVGRTLIAAALVASLAERKSRKDRIALGLRILRERYDNALDVRKDGTTARLQVIAAARRLWDLADNSLPAVIKAETMKQWPKTLARAEGVIGDALSEIENAVHHGQAERVRVASGALVSLSRRVGRFLVEGANVDDSNAYLEELFAVGAGFEPAALARKDLSLMSVQDWSALAFACLASRSLLGDTPSEEAWQVARLAYAALGILGPVNIPLHSPHHVPPEGTLERVAEVARQYEGRLRRRARQARGPARAVLLALLADTRLSPLEPDPLVHPAMALSAPGQEVVATAAGGTWIPENIGVTIALEVEALDSDGSIPSTIESLGMSVVSRARSLAPQRRVDLVFVVAETPARPPTRRDVVVAPTSLREIANAVTAVAAS